MKKNKLSTDGCKKKANNRIMRKITTDENKIFQINFSKQSIKYKVQSMSYFFLIVVVQRKSR